MKKPKSSKKATFGNLAKPQRMQIQGGVRTMAIPKVKKAKSPYGKLKVKK